MIAPNTRALWRAKLYEVIFEHRTPAGRGFDVAFIVVIGLSILAVMLESVVSIRARFGHELRIAEWTFTALSLRPPLVKPLWLRARSDTVDLAG